MTSSALCLLAALALTAAAAPVQTAELPRPGSVDARIQFVEYDPDQVVLIRGSLGYQLMIEFAPDERIENVSIGDSLGWQVTPNRRANVLFLKPIDGSATNMTVLTGDRRYIFELAVAPKSGVITAPFTVRFNYPQPALVVALGEPDPEPERPPQVVNAAYTVTGSKENAPARVFDDGRMTYFEWPADGAIPAIFAVAADGAESIVNYAVRGPYIVVEQLSGSFSLRNGQQVATVVNQTAIQPAPRRGSR